MRYIENSTDFKQEVRGKVEDEKKAMSKLKGNDPDESIEVIRIEREKRYEESVAREKEAEARAEAEKRKREKRKQKSSRPNLRPQEVLGPTTLFEAKACLTSARPA